MDIQRQAFEMQIAFEKHCAISCGISYEYLKAQLDNTESIFGKRYMETSPRHEKWLVWSEAWQQAQKVAVPEGFVLVPKEPTWGMTDGGCSAISHGRTNEENVNRIYKAMIEVQEQN